MATIDLNADLGESFGVWRLGDDAAMLDVVTSANVACGFHAGDPSTLRRTCADAVARGVAIGAQVSFPDLAGFGRRRMDMDPAELRDAVLYQIGALDAFASVAGGRVAYVKPHGALYHVTVDDRPAAEAVVDAVREYRDDLAVLGLASSELLDRAEHAGVRPVPEAFADRAYRSDGTLVPRSAPGAVLDDAEAVAERVVRMVVDGVVEAVDGTTVPIRAASVCVHGDTPGAVGLAQAVRSALDRAGVGLAAFTA